jgi:hypothetical protein
MPYPQRVDYLDDSYYHKVFYKYYAWLDSMLPPDRSFSILFGPSASNDYLRYERKMNYYFYPRYVLPGEKELFGYAGNVGSLKGVNDIKSIRYSDMVLILKNAEVPYKRNGRLKYIHLNGKIYYLVSVLDNKGLLAVRSFIYSDIRKNKEWAVLRNEFRKLYGINMAGVPF